MVKATNVNLDDAADYPNYKEIINDPNITILMETYHTNKDGDAFCIIKYNEPSDGEKNSAKDCSPCRI
jgi:hypothetical protein